MTSVKQPYGAQVWYFVKFLNQLHGILEHDVRRTGLIPGGQNVVIAVLNHRRQLMRWLQLRAPVRVRKPNNKSKVSEGN